MDPVSLVSIGCSVTALATQLAEHIKSIQSLAKHSFAYGPLSSQFEYARLQLVVSLQKLVRWKNVWSLDDLSLSRRDQTHSIWGNKGWKEIQKLLTIIDDECKDIYIVVQGYENSKCSSSTPKRSASIRWLHQKRKKHSFDDKAWQNKIDTFSCHVDHLCTISDSYFRDNHQRNPTIPWSIKLDDLFDAIWQGREVSQACYDFVNSQARIAYLDLDILHGKDFSDCSHESLKSQLFHVYEKRDESWVLDHLALAPFDKAFQYLDDPRNPVVLPKKSSKKNQSHSSFDGMIRSDSVEENVLASNSTIDHEDSRRKDCLLGPFEDLTTFLRPSPTHHSSFHTLSRGEKLGLASKAAEVFLFTIGTSWADNLNNAALMRASNPDNPCQHLMTLAKVPNQQNESILQKTCRQMHEFGKFLLELALNRRCSEAASPPPSIESPELLEATHEMGQQYVEACVFCLDMATISSIAPSIRDLDHQGERISLCFQGQSSTNRRCSTGSEELWQVIEDEQNLAAKMFLIRKQFCDSVYSRLRENLKSVIIQVETDD